MTSEICELIFILSLIFCGAMLIVSIILFFFLKIPKSVGIITGYTAKKAIKNINRQSEMSMSERLDNEGKKNMKNIFSSSGTLKRATEKLLSNQDHPIINAKADTSVLHQTDENLTAVLPSVPEENIGNTAVLNPMSSDETTVLGGENTSLTTVLPHSTEGTVYPSNVSIETEITLIHTNEII